jgi:hypothetical protein
MPRAKSKYPKDRHPELAYLEQIPSQKDKTGPEVMNEPPLKTPSLISNFSLIGDPFGRRPANWIKDEDLYFSFSHSTY